MHVCMNCKISYAQYMSWIDPDTVVALVVSDIWLSDQPTQAGAPLKKNEFINQSYIYIYRYLFILVYVEFMVNKTPV